MNSLEGLQILPGMCVAERYEIICVLGRGLMSVVHLARDRKTNQAVALKVIAREVSAKPGALNVIMLGAETAHQLNHSNIVRFYDLEIWNDTAFITMEYLACGSLSHLMAESGGRLVRKTGFLMLRQIAAALDFAHNSTRPVFHLALSPSNILFSKNNRIKIADFGIARRIRDLAERISEREVMQNQFYLAPEQILNQETGPHTDVYALAAIAYELFSGKPPFQGMDLRARILQQEAAPVEGLSRDINQALQAGLAKDPACRPISAGNLVAMLAGEKPVRSFSVSSSSPPKIVSDLIHRQAPLEAKQAPSINGERAGTKRRRIRVLFLFILPLLFILGSAGFYIQQRFAEHLTVPVPDELKATTAVTVLGNGDVGHLPGPRPSMPAQKPIIPENDSQDQDVLHEAGDENKPAESSDVSAGQSKSKLTITSIPPGGEAYLDGLAKGITPLTMEAEAAGGHLLSIKMKGFDLWQAPIDLAPDKPLQLEIKLTPSMGAIKVVSLPAGAEVYMDGAMVGLTPLTLAEVSKGRRRVMVRRAGHRNWETSVEVIPGEAVEVRADLQTETGVLNIISTPDNADVSISGKSHGRTPLRLEIPAEGGIKLLISKTCFAPIHKDVSISPGMTMELSFALLPTCGRLIVDSNPAGAAWFLDGVEMGRTPGEALDIHEGRHKFLFQKEQYKNFPMEVEVRAGQDNRIQAKLETELPEPGEIRSDPLANMDFIWIPKEAVDTPLKGQKPLPAMATKGGVWMGRTEITQEQWLNVMKTNPSFFNRGEQYPVDNVSWTEVQDFIGKLNEKGGGKVVYRLPTEREWEYVCRLNDVLKDTLGAESTFEMAWYKDNSRRTSHPVMQKRAGSMGLYDMHGNVREWVTDMDQEAKAGPKVDSLLDEKQSISRVTKGGGWRQPPQECGCSDRKPTPQETRDHDLGFRLVKEK